MQNRTMHAVIGSLFLIAGLLVILIFVTLRSAADEATTSADLNNIAPTIDTLVIATSSFDSAITEFNLTELTTTSIYIHGTYTDENGCEEVDNPAQNIGGDIDDDDILIVTFIRSGLNGGALESCNPGGAPDTSTNPLDCYIGANTTTYVGGGGIPFDDACTFSQCTPGTGDNDGAFECIFDIQFFADATDVTSSPNYAAENWEAYAYLADYSGDGDTASTTVEMNTLLAIDLSGGTTINYGVLSLNATSSPVTLEVRNSGNYASTDLAISGTHMPCDLGTLATSSQRFSSTSEDYEDMILSLSSSSQDIGLSIYKQITSTTQATSNTYWTLTTPSTGVLGTCSGTNTIQAAL